MFDVEAFVGGTADLWILGLTGAALILITIVIIQSFQLRSLKRRYHAIWQNANGLDLEQLLARHAGMVEGAQTRLQTLEQRFAQMETDVRSHVQHLGVVRFNAFADTGSDLSFAIALLDDHTDGVVLSSLYGRDESRVYAKPVRAGTSSYFLTAEEKQALEIALQPQPPGKKS